MTACARTTNITCHSTVDGVLEISVQDRAQAVVMATKHPELAGEQKSRTQCCFEVFFSNW